LAAAPAFGGLAIVGASLARQAPGPSVPASSPPPAAKAQAEPAAKPAEALAWRRTDRYEPPDFDRFFPDDPAGARRLKALWEAADKDKRPDEEVLPTVRRGLRGVDGRTRNEVVRWFGNRSIAGRPDPNPEAVEIMYHASGAGKGRPEFNETRYWAVYFGLS